MKRERILEATCAICFEGYNNDDASKKSYYFFCGHVICHSCSSILERVECPTCGETTPLFPDGSLVRKLHLNLEEIPIPDPSGALVTENQELRSVVESKEEALADLTRALDDQEVDHKRTLKKKEDELKEKRVELKDMKAETKLTDTQIGNLQRNLADTQETLTKRQRELAFKDKQLEDERKLLRDKTQRLDGCTSKASQMEKDLMAIKAEGEGRTSLIRELQKKIEESEQEAATARNDAKVRADDAVRISKEHEEEVASLKRKVEDTQQTAEDQARIGAAQFLEISLQFQHCREELNVEREKLERGEKANQELILEKGKLAEALRCHEQVTEELLKARAEDEVKLENARQQETGLRVHLKQCREELSEERSRRQLLEKTVAELIASKKALKTALEDLHIAANHSVTEGKDKMLARVNLDAAAEREELEKEIARSQQAAKQQAEEDAVVRDELALQLKHCGQELETARSHRLILEDVIGELEAGKRELAEALAHEQREIAEKDKQVDREVEALTRELRDLTEAEVTRCRRERRSTDALAAELQAARGAIEKDRTEVDRKKASLARNLELVKQVVWFKKPFLRLVHEQAQTDDERMIANAITKTLDEMSLPPPLRLEDLPTQLPGWVPVMLTMLALIGQAYQY